MLVTDFFTEPGCFLSLTVVVICYSVPIAKGLFCSTILLWYICQPHFILYLSSFSFILLKNILSANLLVYKSLVASSLSKSILFCLYLAQILLDALTIIIISFSLFNPLINTCNLHRIVPLCI